MSWGRPRWRSWGVTWPSLPVYLHSCTGISPVDRRGLYSCKVFLLIKHSPLVQARNTCMQQMLLLQARFCMLASAMRQHHLWGCNLLVALCTSTTRGVCDEEGVRHYLSLMPQHWLLQASSWQQASWALQLPWSWVSRSRRPCQLCSPWSSPRQPQTPSVAPRLQAPAA